MNRALIVCGFPGVGKTVLERYERVVDLESRVPLVLDGRGKATASRVAEELHPGDRRSIKGLPENHSGINSEVLEALKDSGMTYIIVLPTKDCKEEYMRRYLRRGSDYGFLHAMYYHFDDYLNDLEKDYAPKIYLVRGEYLADVLPPL